MPDADAAVTADSLIRADLEGNEGHGISRLPIYARRLKEGRIAANPQITFRRSGSILQVDGGNGLGQVVAYRAIEHAIPIAREQGIAAVWIRGSNHFGTAAYFCQMACDRQMALIAMTNSPPAIAPWGGKKAFFGTNPIAFGFPVREQPPVIVDMSSSVAARGKIILAAKTGAEIPPGWAMDENGKETTNPKAALNGALLPIGGAKGYALAMAIELMCGVLSGAAYGPHVNNLYQDGDGPANVGHCFILLDIAAWMPIDEYFDIINQFLLEVKHVPPAADSPGIYYPGERRSSRYAERIEQGLHISGEVAAELRQLAHELGAAFPEGGAVS
jgi:LDH2 family malate/lactate/ureidoglycolate dehydrogenase